MHLVIIILSVCDGGMLGCWRAEVEGGRVCGVKRLRGSWGTRAYTFTGQQNNNRGRKEARREAHSPAGQGVANFFYKGPERKYQMLWTMWSLSTA